MKSQLYNDVYILRLFISTGGTDFQSLSQNLVFNSMSSPSDCIATVNIPILQDFTVEGTELFFVFLSSSDESVELISTTVIIQDDDGEYVKSLECILWLAYCITTRIMNFFLVSIVMQKNLGT